MRKNYEKEDWLWAKLINPSIKLIQFIQINFVY